MYSVSSHVVVHDESQSKHHPAQQMEQNGDCMYLLLGYRETTCITVTLEPSLYTCTCYMYLENLNSGNFRSPDGSFMLSRKLCSWPKLNDSYIVAI